MVNLFTERGDLFCSAEVRQVRPLRSLAGYLLHHKFGGAHYLSALHAYKVNAGSISFGGDSRDSTVGILHKTSFGIEYPNLVGVFEAEGLAFECYAAHTSLGSGDGIGLFDVGFVSHTLVAGLDSLAVVVGTGDFHGEVDGESLGGHTACSGMGEPCVAEDETQTALAGLGICRNGHVEGGA